MQDFSIKLGNQPIDCSVRCSLLEPCQFATRHACVSAFKLHEPNIEKVTVFSTETEGDSINDSRSGSTSLALEKCDLPPVLFAVGFQSRFTCGFRRVCSFPRAHTPSGLPHLARSSATFPRACRFLAARQFIRHAVRLAFFVRCDTLKNAKGAIESPLDVLAGVTRWHGPALVVYHGVL